MHDSNFYSDVIFLVVGAIVLPVLIWESSRKKHADNKDVKKHLRRLIACVVLDKLVSLFGLLA
jgi:hypothetical protein